MNRHVAPNLSRRHFLGGTAALGVIAVTAGGFKPKEPDWTGLEKSLAGPVIRPGDSRFSRAVEPFNLAYNVSKLQPVAIAMCANRADVATAVKWAHDNNRHPVIRAGGHSYAGYSMGPELMIDVSAMRRFSWDTSRQQLTIESGARNGDLANVLRAEHRTLTHGRCPTVGIAGFLLGGGIGFNMRKYGVGSDLLLSTDIVTADGTIRTVAGNDDLFWACRGGGGGNFGINTAFTLDTRPENPVSVFHIERSGRRDRIADVAFRLMEMLGSSGEDVGSRLSISRKPGVDFAGIDLLGQFHGPQGPIRARLDDALAPLSKTQGDEVRELAYWDGQDFLSELGGPNRFQERSAFLNRNLSRPEIDVALDRLWKWPGSRDRTIQPDVRFFQTGGAINKVDGAATAFVHRDSKWLMDIGLPWSSEDSSSAVAASREWLNRAFAALSKFGNGRSYQNFADPSFKRDESHKAYYGTNLQKLRQVKHDCDPDNLFRFDQSIQPSQGNP